MRSLEANSTYTLEPTPPGVKVLPTRWVFKKKVGGDGEVKFKARLVAKGFAQQEGVDYTEVYAPTGKHTTLRTLVSMVATGDWELHQLDITTAFLNGPLEEEVWVTQPEGFQKYGNEVSCRLHKALYGLKQTPRAWYTALKGALEKMGWKAGQADSALFTRETAVGLVVMLVYVDDILVASRSLGEVQRAKRELLERFAGRDLGEAGVYLGIEIVRDRAERTITLTQRANAAALVEKFGMGEAKGKSTPLDLGMKLSKVGPAMEWDGGGKNPYAEMVGSLLYLSNCTRPDLAHATSQLARFMAAPTQQHWGAAKGVLRYLAGTLGMGIQYGKGNSQVVGYGDADYAGCVDTRRSTTGYIFMLNGGAVSWSSKRQSCVTLSTAEAEYVAAATAVKEALWFRKLEGDLQLGGDGQRVGREGGAA